MNLLKVYQNIWLRNIILGIVYFIIVYMGVRTEEHYTDSNPEILNDKGHFIMQMGIVYVLFYLFTVTSNLLLVKQLLLEKKYRLFIVLFVLYWILFYLILNAALVTVGLKPLTMLGLLVSVINGTGMYFLHIWIMRNILQAQKSMLDAETEISFLKQQLNPHFLLNAMNNLYGEALASPETVPDKILNLSALLRYQIEATQKEYVSIEEEIDFIKKYIDDYRFRSNNLKISEEYIGKYDHLKIPPLFFLPLVENAVKFSAETGEPFIDIVWKFAGNNMVFTIENNFIVKGSKLNGTGVGLENLRRRLEVSQFKNELTCTKSETGVFNLKLELWGLPIDVCSLTMKCLRTK